MLLSPTSAGARNTSWSLDFLTRCAFWRPAGCITQEMLVSAAPRNIHLSICIRHEDENDHVLSVHVTASRAAQSVGRHWNANIACWLSHYLSWLILIRNLSSVVFFCRRSHFFTTDSNTFTYKSHSRLKRIFCVRCVRIINIFPWLFNGNRPLQSILDMVQFTALSIV